MKKLALAISLGAYVVFGASSGALAAYRADNTAGVATNRDSRIAWSETGTNARLLFLNEALYPDTTATEDAVLAHRKGERAAMVATEDAVLAQRKGERAAGVATEDAVLAHRKGERAMAQTDTSNADTERLFCEGDICIVP